MRGFIETNISRDNNYDLIRLIAALQVVLLHASHHLGLNIFPPLDQLLRLFPGVPVFFFISGMLVTPSLFRSQSLKSYSMKRIKRVFPALWLVLFISVIILISFGQIDLELLSRPLIWVWFVCQATLVQFYNPSFFRDFGVGVINGSLWTIPVEVSFYIALPILVFIASRFKSSVPVFKSLVVIGAIFSFFLWLYVEGFSDKKSITSKLFLVSLLPHFWQFGLGVFAAIYHDRIKRALNGKVLLLVGAYITCGFAAHYFMAEAFAYAITAPLLYMTIFALGSCTVEVTKKTLQGWDISYGLYLIHMPIINIFVETGLVNNWVIYWTAVGLSIFIAGLSWKYLESRVLKR